MSRTPAPSPTTPSWSPRTRRYPLGSLWCDDIILASMKDVSDERTISSHLRMASLYAVQLRWALAALPHALQRAEALLTAEGKPSTLAMPSDLLPLLESLGESLDVCRDFLAAWAESETCLLAKAVQEGPR